MFGHIEAQSSCGVFCFFVFDDAISESDTSQSADSTDVVVVQLICT